MKTYKRIFTAVATLLVVVSCSDVERERNTSLPNLSSLGLTRAHEEIAASQMDFGVEFFKAVSSRNNESVLVSPFSISLDLSMLAHGATGSTYHELTKGLGFEGYTPEQIGEYYSAIISADTLTKRGTFKTANALWVNTEKDRSGVSDSYKEDVRMVYDALVDTLDFSKKPIVEIVNNWSSDKTEGRIPKILDKEPSNCVALLASALYFNEPWNGVYQQTKKVFNGLKNKAVQTFFTGNSGFVEEYNTEWDNSAEPAMLSLFYADGFIARIIVPPAKTSFSDFVGNLSASKLGLWIKESKPVGSGVEMTFYVPVFRKDCNIDGKTCQKALEKVGIKEIFDISASLDKIGRDIYVKEVAQKTFIDFNERGTEAAAVTIAELNGAIAPPPPRKYDFVVDRPFVYVIMDRYQSILFMGSVTDIN